MGLAAGYCGEAHFVNAWLGFAVGMAGWFFILFEIFVGEAGNVAATGDKVNEHVKASFQTMRFIVSVGWSIYPLGYFFGYLMGGVDDSALNLVQPRGLREQDRVLPRDLGFCEEEHGGKGGQSPRATLIASLHESFPCFFGLMRDSHFSYQGFPAVLQCCPQHRCFGFG